MATTPAPTSVLITGGNGYLAQHLIQRLLPSVTRGELRLGYTHTKAEPPLALASDRLWAGRAELTDRVGLEGVMEDFRPNVLIHAAAFSSPAGCEKDPAKAMAVNCPSGLLDALAKFAPDCLLVFMSTDQVFSGTQPLGAIYTEEDKAVPANVYGRSKLVFEQLLKERHPHHVILRSSNIIGEPSPYLPQPKFLQWLDDKLKTTTTPLELFDDEVRSFVYVGDILDAMEGIVAKWTAHMAGSSAIAREEKDSSSSASCSSSSSSSSEWRQLFHMGGPAPLSRVGLAKEVCAQRGYPLTLTDGEQQPRFAPVARASLDLGFTSPLNIGMDSSKLAQAGVGFQPKSMAQALQAIFGRD